MKRRAGVCLVGTHSDVISSIPDTTAHEAESMEISQWSSL
jgi:hypothetical protein